MNRIAYIKGYMDKTAQHTNNDMRSAIMQGFQDADREYQKSPSAISEPWPPVADPTQPPHKARTPHEKSIEKFVTEHPEILNAMPSKNTSKVAYIKGYMDKTAEWKGLGYGASAASPLAQGVFANPWLLSAAVGAVPGGLINLWRNWDNEDQSRWKSLLKGMGAGAAAGLGYQALFPNNLKYQRKTAPTQYFDTASPAIQNQIFRLQNTPLDVNPGMQQLMSPETMVG